MDMKRPAPIEATDGAYCWLINRDTHMRTVKVPLALKGKLWADWDAGIERYPTESKGGE